MFKQDQTTESSKSFFYFGIILLIIAVSAGSIVLTRKTMQVEGDFDKAILEKEIAVPYQQSIKKLEDKISELETKNQEIIKTNQLLQEQLLNMSNNTTTATTTVDKIINNKDN